MVLSPFRGRDSAVLWLTFQAFVYPAISYSFTFWKLVRRFDINFFLKRTKEIYEMFIKSQGCELQQVSQIFIG